MTHATINANTTTIGDTIAATLTLFFVAGFGGNVDGLDVFGIGVGCDSGGDNGGGDSDGGDNGGGVGCDSFDVTFSTSSININ